MCQSAEVNLSGDVVLKMTSTLQTGNNYKIFAHNFFTSTGLIEKLLERDIHYTGTVRSGRLPGSIMACELVSDVACWLFQELCSLLWGLTINYKQFKM